MNLSLRRARGFVALLFFATILATILATSLNPGSSRAADGAATPSAAPPTPAPPPVGGAIGNNVATQGPTPIVQLVQQLDELYKKRDDRASLALSQSVADEAVARAPKDFEVLWRAARLSFWISDDPGVDTGRRSTIGKAGWELAERAIALAPRRVEGPYFAAFNIGNYALGLGIMKALSIGLEGKFRGRLEEAEKMDPGYGAGAIDVAWGRFYQKLPWPKRDRNKSADHLVRAIKTFPRNLRARVFLASLYIDDDKPDEARRLLDEVMAAPLGDDPPENRRAKALATGMLAELNKKK